MADHATPNLPARDFGATKSFYAALGFETGFKDDGWMILSRNGAVLEFFPYPELKPQESSFSCCIRLDDLDAMITAAKDAGVPLGNDKGIPRITSPRREASGLMIAYMVDPDGSLLRLIPNQSAA